jgi:hypothetical protein
MSSKLLPCPTFNSLAGTAHKTLFLCCCSTAAQRTVQKNTIPIAVCGPPPSNKSTCHNIVFLNPRQYRLQEERVKRVPFYYGREPRRRCAACVGAMLPTPMCMLSLTWMYTASARTPIYTVIKYRLVNVSYRTTIDVVSRRILLLCY